MLEKLHGCPLSALTSIHHALAAKVCSPPVQDLGSKRNEWLLVGAGIKIANDQNGGALQRGSIADFEVMYGPTRAGRT